MFFVMCQNVRISPPCLLTDGMVGSLIIGWMERKSGIPGVTAPRNARDDTNTQVCSKGTEQ